MYQMWKSFIIKADLQLFLSFFPKYPVGKENSILSHEQTFLMKPKVDFCFKELMEDTIRRMYSDKLEIHILELPKLAERQYPQTELLKWASFFQAEKKEEFEMAAEGSSYIERAYERLTEISADDLKRLEYESREKAIRDHIYLMNYNLKKGLEEGKEEGRKEGREEGLEEGLTKGRQEGIEQGMKVLIKFCREYSCTREETCSRLVQNFSVSFEEAEKYLKKYWTVQL